MTLRARSGRAHPKVATRQRERRQVCHIRPRRQFYEKNCENELRHCVRLSQPRLIGSEPVVYCLSRSCHNRNLGSPRYHRGDGAMTVSDYVAIGATDRLDLVGRGAVLS
jgi:hypothetical protein